MRSPAVQGVNGIGVYGMLGRGRLYHGRRANLPPAPPYIVSIVEFLLVSSVR